MAHFSAAAQDWPHDLSALTRRVSVNNAGSVRQPFPDVSSSNVRGPRWLWAACCLVAADLTSAAGLYGADDGLDPDEQRRANRLNLGTYSAKDLSFFQFKILSPFRITDIFF